MGANRCVQRSSLLISIRLLKIRSCSSLQQRPRSYRGIPQSWSSRLPQDSEPSHVPHGESLRTRRREPFRPASSRVRRENVYRAPPTEIVLGSKCSDKPASSAAEFLDSQRTSAPQIS